MVHPHRVINYYAQLDLFSQVFIPLVLYFSIALPTRSLINPNKCKHLHGCAGPSNIVPMIIGLIPRKRKSCKCECESETEAAKWNLATIHFIIYTCEKMSPLSSANKLNSTSPWHTERWLKATFYQHYTMIIISQRLKYKTLQLVVCSCSMTAKQINRPWIIFYRNVALIMICSWLFGQFG